jgi:hypothetical protein
MSLGLVGYKQISTLDMHWRVDVLTEEGANPGINPPVLVIVPVVY